MDAVCRDEGRCLWCLFEVLKVPQEKRADLLASLNEGEWEQRKWKRKMWKINCTGKSQKAVLRTERWSVYSFKPNVCLLCVEEIIFKAASRVSFADNNIPECIATSLVVNVSKIDMQTINIHIVMLDIIFLNRAFIIIYVTIIKQYTDCDCSKAIMTICKSIQHSGAKQLSRHTYSKFDITHNSCSLRIYRPKPCQK